VAVRVVVDTNVWISSLIASSKTAARLVDEWREGKFEIVISEQQVLELYDVFSRPKFLFKYCIYRQEIEDLVSSIATRAQRITIKGSTKLCRDPDDDIIIETAMRGKAKYLVTGDKDIKDDKEVLSYLSQRGVTVVSISKFLDLMSKTR
jgi:putative PIN family toxin of toxin-antitoxin system